MALRPTRVESVIEFNGHERWIPAEAGGLISYSAASGVDISVYAADPSGVNAIGIQRHDVIENDRPDLFPRPRTRKIQQTFTDKIFIITKGEVTTNFIHPDSEGYIYAGVTAYAGPSGLITHDASYKGNIIGYFMADLVADERTVMIEGGGYYRQEIYTDPSTGERSIVDVGYPRTSVTTPGWVKIRLAIEDG
jgi:hypothetical protein